jgi:tRNA threonylcarbamoyladenosine biosynthesis protein TsaE
MAGADEPSSREARSPRSAPAARARTVFSLSEQETFDLGRSFARGLRGGEVVLLEGELGLGKTVFARGVAVGLGIPAEDVSSPSFTLVQEYRGGRLTVFHVDLYRLHAETDTDTLGIEDLVASGAVVLVEWGEKLPPFYKRDAIRVRLHDLGEGSRRIELVERDPRGRPRRGDA